MCRTGMSRFGIKNWIFLLVSLQLFTYAQGDGEELEPGVSFSLEPGDALGAPGAALLLPCAARTHRAARLAWRHSVGALPTRDHQLSPTDKYRKQLPNGSLVIESMSSALAGQYQCVVSVDGVGTIVSRIATVFLAEVPELASGPGVVLVPAGGAALLPCHVRATPRVAPRLAPPAPPRPSRHPAPRAPPALKLHVTWLRNGSPVGPEARAALLAGGALELEPLTPADAGRYRCRVALLAAPHLYRDGEEIELKVGPELSAETPPRFVATPQPATVMEGASVTFDCAAVGNPKPQITWLNNGVAIDLNDLDSRFHLSGAGSLSVAAARAQDAGVYTCRAHSRLDSSDHSAALHVQTAPRAEAPRDAVSARAGGDAVLRCAARGRPAPRALWLKDGDLLTPNNRDIALVDGTSLRIQGVLSVDAGMFQCMATSPAGSSTAPVRLIVLPPEDDVLCDVSEQPPDDPEDFLGETSSAYTLPDSTYDTFVTHAAEGLDVVNASSSPAPTGLRAVIVKHRFVTLSWEAPEDGDVTGYAVIYRVKGSERERVSKGGPKRHEMNVASLQPNTTYQFQVAALYKHGASPRTEMIEVQTAEEEFTHGPPQRVQAEPAGPHALRVAWAPPAPPAAPPRTYTLHYTEVESGREQYQQVDVDPALDLISHTITGLRAATSYSVEVSAGGGPEGAGVGGVGGPAAGAGAPVRTPAAAPSAPPLNVTAAAAGATSIIVRWEAPPSRTLGGPLTGYKVRYRAAPPALAPAPAPAPAPGRRKAGSLTTPADTRHVEITDLETATSYQVRVWAVNGAGAGPGSEWAGAATLAQPRQEPAVPPPPPPLTTRSGRDWISVWWAPGEAGAGGAGGPAARGYLLGWGLGVPDEMSRSLPAHARSHVIRGLESNAEYVISLRASNSRGLGPAVYGTVRTKAAGEGDEPEGDEFEGDGEEEDEEDEEPTPLIPPVGVKAIMLSGTTAVVYWTDPTLPKGQSVADGRRYVVRWAVASGGGGGGGGGGAGGGAPPPPPPPGKVRYFNATDLNCMLDELKPYTQYEFSVKLIKGPRESAWSMLVVNRSLEAPPASPPRELRAAPAPPAARAVDLAWLPPAKPNGLITGYVVMWAAARGGGGGGAEEWSSLALGGERTRARLERLRPRTSYLLRLQARNSRGLGPACAPLHYTTPAETGGEGGGLASATSAWLWASAGGACAVLALAAALALSLCCRGRAVPDTSAMVSSTYQKSSASAGIKPPDLWIHHDQMELKHMDKTLHSSASKISAGSAEGGLMSSSLTLGGRAPPAEYEPPLPPASLDRRHYVPTYVDYRGASLGSDDTAPLRPSPSPCPSPFPSLPPSLPPSPLVPLPPLCGRCDDYIKPMTGIGPGCAATCDRRHRLPHPDQSTPLLASPAGASHSHSHLHHPHSCGGSACPLGGSCGSVPPPGPHLPPGGAHLPPGAPHLPPGGPHAPAPGGDIYACAARERGHYVAYEPLGHYTHRDSVSSEAGAGGPGGAGGAGGARGAPLHSFALGDLPSSHTTPTHSHSRGSVRETSPYKKSASSSPGHVPNRLNLGGCGVAECREMEELEPLAPSRSSERLQRDMRNLEGLMKDLSAITQHQFHC